MGRVWRGLTDRGRYTSEINGVRAVVVDTTQRHPPWPQGPIGVHPARQNNEFQSNTDSASSERDNSNETTPLIIPDPIVIDNPSRDIYLCCKNAIHLMGMIDDDFMIIVTDSHDFVLNVFRKKDLH